MHYKQPKNKRILFMLNGNSSRSGCIDCESIRTGGVGGSGTDQSVIIVAEQLALNGWEPVIACEKPKYGTTRKVLFTDMALSTVTDRTFDVLVNPLWFDKLHDLPITAVKVLVIWCHVQYIYAQDSIMHFHATHKCRIAVVYLSKWTRERPQPMATVKTLRTIVPDLVEVEIPNPVMMDVVNIVNVQSIVREPQSVFFHALWHRSGGVLAKQTTEELGWRQFDAIDYLSRNALDKQAVLQKLAKADYFIYPMISHTGDVLKDTFGCVVAEACAMGAIVVTYPIAALPDHFEGAAIWASFPEGIDVDHICNDTVTIDIKMVCTKPFIEAVQALEKDPIRKERVRDVARKLVLNRFNPEVIGSKWIAFLDEMLSGT